MDNSPQQSEDTKPAPTPYREELKVMETVADAFDGIDQACRIRIWRWLADRYQLNPRFC